MNYDYLGDDAFCNAMKRMCEEQNKKYIKPTSVTILKIDHGKSLVDLKWFPNLKNLQLAATDLENLKELAKLPRLTALSLEACDIRDTSVIWELKHLSSLRICLSDIGGAMCLKKLDKLKELTLDEIDLPSSTGLSMLCNLEKLILHDCGLKDISFVSSMKKLRHINVSRNHIKDISALKVMGKLESVFLWENEIADLSPLKELTKINRLSIGGNPIDRDRCSLNEFKSIGRITVLYIDELCVEKHALTRAKRIKKLSVGGKNCTDISFLKDLKHIEELHLIGSRVKDISPLLELLNLKFLWLEHNDFITDYYPVHALRKAGKKIVASGPSLSNKYVELRIHTQYSHAGSIISHRALRNFFLDHEVKAIAITDYHSVAAFPDIKRCFQGLQTKIIYGLETRTENGHITLLAKNRRGLKNLYKIISLLGDDAQNGVVAYEQIMELRDDLLMGSACEHGILAKAISKGQSWAELKQIAQDFDYLEISPVFTEDTVKTIIKLGKEFSIPVCAVSDARFLKPEEEFLLRIHNDSDSEPSHYLRDIRSKNCAFSYLEEETREQIIHHNPAMIADMTEAVSLFSRNERRYDMDITGQSVIDETTKKAAQLYHKAYIQPEIRQRLETEQKIIARRGHATLYRAAKIAADVLREGGYPVMARGAVGSSFAAFLMGITEVNPLPPHQFCRACGYFKWLSDLVSGYDCIDVICPDCGAPLSCDGHNIPMETFFGQSGENQPIVEINVSERIREKVIEALENAFGKTKILRASAMHMSSEVFSLENIEAFCKKHGYSVSDIDAQKIAQDFAAIRRETTGHHSGVYILPQNAKAGDYTPVVDIDGQPCAYYQHPDLRDQLHCLQLPAHNLYDLFPVLWQTTGVSYNDVPITSEALSLFSSSEKLGICCDNLISGTAGLPEFGSARAQHMIRQLRPETFSDYVKIHALCHGTKVWEKNQEEPFLSGNISLRELITTRDDVFQMLIGKGMDRKRAYQMMEAVRKGRACTIFEQSSIGWAGASYLTETQMQILKKIEYLFPKAHAVAYTILASKMAWYKLYYPKEFYQAYLDINSLPDNFTEDISKGTEYVQNRVKQINSQGVECAEQPDDAIYAVAYELMLRGYCINKNKDGRIEITEQCTKNSAT